MTLKYLQHPIANLRRQPIAFSGEWKDPLQETQILLGDPVHVIKEEGEWSFVNLPQQQKFDPSTKEWIGYPGWVESRFLGDKPLKESSLTSSSKIDSARLVQDALQFLGTPYFWGGASCFDPTDPKATGVDCSGLVYLLHKMQGIFLPRDAHDQWLKSKPVNGNELEIGDLIFREWKEKPGRIDHVILYGGDGRLIEAVIQPGVVREISFAERLGSAPEKFDTSKTTWDNQIFYFGKIGK